MGRVGVDLRGICASVGGWRCVQALREVGVSIGIWLGQKAGHRVWCHA